MEYCISSMAVRIMLSATIFVIVTCGKNCMLHLEQRYREHLLSRGLTEDPKTVDFLYEKFIF